MCGIDTRICCTRLSQQVYGLIDMAKEKLAYTQSPIRGIDIRIVRTEPDRFLDVGDCCLWLAQIHQDEAELSKGPRVSVERCSCLELDPGFGQSVLNATKHSHRPVCHRVIRVPLEYFEEQLLGAGLVLLDKVAPTFEQVAHQRRCDADPGADRSRVDLQRQLEGPSRLFSVSAGGGPVKPGPAAHNEITRIGSACVVLLAAEGRRLQ